MQPSSKMLLERIALALDQTVIPALDDKWAASTVRSAVALLRHLAKRVELEAAIVAADNIDSRAVLQTISSKLTPGEDDALTSDIAAALSDGSWRSTADTQATDALNGRYQGLFDRLLRDQYTGPWTDGDQPVRADIRAYLKRRMAREHAMYFPEFIAPPF